MSHYKWLDDHLEAFWINVFGKGLSATGCGGIISAHGDKVYQYKKYWEESGVPFYHGAAIYLLTYTKELGETPKHLSNQWVVDNYQRYKSLLPSI